MLIFGTISKVNFLDFLKKQKLQILSALHRFQHCRKNGTEKRNKRSRIFSKTLRKRFLLDKYLSLKKLKRIYKIFFFNISWFLNKSLNFIRNKQINRNKPVYGLFDFFSIIYRKKYYISIVYRFILDLYKTSDNISNNNRFFDFKLIM